MTADTAIYFKQQKLGFEEYNKFLEDLTINRKISLQDIKSKMASCRAPGLTGVSSRAKSTTVVHLTDTNMDTLYSPLVTPTMESACNSPTEISRVVFRFHCSWLSNQQCGSLKPMPNCIWPESAKRGQNSTM
jgi:hypothetical protein